MAEGEGIKLTDHSPSEDVKQAMEKGKAKQPTQGQGCDVSVSPGSSSLRQTLVPIAALTPGQPTTVNWQIQGLVVGKSEIKTYKKQGDCCCGLYFSFEMRDQAGGEIRVVCFGSEVDRFFAKVVEGKEHVLARGKLMKPKQRFNHRNRRCEIVLEYDAEIRVLEEEEEEEGNNDNISNNNNKSLLERLAKLRVLEEEEENDDDNKRLLERVTKVEKTLEFCTSKLQELEIEIKKGGKRIENPTGMSNVKIEAPGVVGVSENRAQAEEKMKIEPPVIRKTSNNSSSRNSTSGARLGAMPRFSPIKFRPNGPIE